MTSHSIFGQEMGRFQRTYRIYTGGFNPSEKMGRFSATISRFYDFLAIFTWFHPFHGHTKTGW
jgi:hypothetical protein